MRLQRLTASCVADTLSRMRTSRSNCACRSSCVAGVRGSASSSNDRVCDLSPTESATWYRPGAATGPGAGSFGAPLPSMEVTPGYRVSHTNRFIPAADGTTGSLLPSSTLLVKLRIVSPFASRNAIVTSSSESPSIQ